MSVKKNRLLKVFVVLAWLGVLALALGGILFLLNQGIFHIRSAYQPLASPVQDTPDLPTGTFSVPLTLTPLLPFSPPSPTITLLEQTATTQPSEMPRVDTPTPAATAVDTTAILFLGSDGCTVQKVWPETGRVIQVTLHVPAFTCRGARISPSGDRLAFLRAGSSPRLYTMNLDGSGLRQVSREHVYDYCWSPDGQKLAYAAYIADQGLTGLYFVNADGSGKTYSAYPYISISSTTIHIAWSPDGNWIYAPAENPPGAEVYPFALSASGVELVQLSDGVIDPTTLVSWSPDSQKVMFLQYGADFLYAVSMLKVLGLDGSREVIFYDDPSIEGPTLSPEGYFTAGPFWSPDGRSGLMSAKSSIVAGQDQLLVLDASSRVLFYLTSLIRPVDLAAWSPTGQRIAFLSLADPQIGGVNSLMVLSIGGSGPRTLVDGVGASMPVWVAP